MMSSTTGIVQKWCLRCSTHAFPPFFKDGENLVDCSIAALGIHAQV